MNASENIDEMIVEKAALDSGFRSELMSAPKAAISKHFGLDLPNELEVKVLEDSDSCLNIVLPPASAELGEAELDEVVGGRSAGIAGCKGCTTGSLAKKLKYF